MEKIDRFEIRNPRWSFIFFTVTLCLSIAAGAVFLILYFLKIIASDTLFFQIIVLIMILFSVFGLYVYKKEAFLFDGERFAYIKPFKRSQAIALKDLARVEIQPAGIMLQVLFYDAQGNVAISFLDDGTALRGDLFLTVLEQRNIPYKFFGQVK